MLTIKKDAAYKKFFVMFRLNRNYFICFSNKIIIFAL